MWLNKIGSLLCYTIQNNDLMVDNFIIKIFKAHDFGSVHMHQATINNNNDRSFSPLKW
jgi:hypothetical protein